MQASDPLGVLSRVRVAVLRVGTTPPDVFSLCVAALLSGDTARLPLQELSYEAAHAPNLISARAALSLDFVLEPPVAPGSTSGEEVDIDAFYPGASCVRAVIGFCDATTHSEAELIQLCKEFPAAAAALHRSCGPPLGSQELVCRLFVVAAAEHLLEHASIFGPTTRFVTHGAPGSEQGLQLQLKLEMTAAASAMLASIDAELLMLRLLTEDGGAAAEAPPQQQPPPAAAAASGGGRAGVESAPSSSSSALASTSGPAATLGALLGGNLSTAALAAVTGPRAGMLDFCLSAGLSSVSAVLLGGLKRRFQARVNKRRGELFLMLGSPLDAVEALDRATRTLRATNDLAFAALAEEVRAAALVALEGWNTGLRPDEVAFLPEAAACLREAVSLFDSAASSASDLVPQGATPPTGGGGSGAPSSGGGAPPAAPAAAFPSGDAAAAAAAAAGGAMSPAEVVTCLGVRARLRLSRYLLACGPGLALDALHAAIAGPPSGATAPAPSAPPSAVSFSLQQQLQEEEGHALLAWSANTTPQSALHPDNGPARGTVTRELGSAAVAASTAAGRGSGSRSSSGASGGGAGAMAASLLLLRGGGTGGVPGTPGPQTAFETAASAARVAAATAAASSAGAGGATGGAAAAAGSMIGAPAPRPEVLDLICAVVGRLASSGCGPGGVGSSSIGGVLYLVHNPQAQVRALLFAADTLELAGWTRRAEACIAQACRVLRSLQRVPLVADFCGGAAQADYVAADEAGGLAVAWGALRWDACLLSEPHFAGTPPQAALGAAVAFSDGSPTAVGLQATTAAVARQAVAAWPLPWLRATGGGAGNGSTGPAGLLPHSGAGGSRQAPPPSQALQQQVQQALSLRLRRAAESTLLLSSPARTSAATAAPAFRRLLHTSPGLLAALLTLVSGVRGSGMGGSEYLIRSPDWGTGPLGRGAVGATVPLECTQQQQPFPAKGTAGAKSEPGDSSSTAQEEETSAASAAPASPAPSSGAARSAAGGGGPSSPAGGRGAFRRLFSQGGDGSAPPSASKSAAAALASPNPRGTGGGAAAPASPTPGLGAVSQAAGARPVGGVAPSSSGSFFSPAPVGGVRACAPAPRVLSPSTQFESWLGAVAADCWSCGDLVLMLGAVEACIHLQRLRAGGGGSSEGGGKGLLLRLPSSSRVLRLAGGAPPPRAFTAMQQQRGGSGVAPSSLTPTSPPLQSASVAAGDRDGGCSSSGSLSSAAPSLRSTPAPPPPAIPAPFHAFLCTARSHRRAACAAAAASLTQSSPLPLLRAALNGCVVSATMSPVDAAAALGLLAAMAADGPHAHSHQGGNGGGAPAPGVDAALGCRRRPPRASATAVEGITSSPSADAASPPLARDALAVGSVADAAPHRAADAAAGSEVGTAALQQESDAGELGAREPRPPPPPPPAAPGFGGGFIGALLAEPCLSPTAPEGMRLLPLPREGPMGQSVPPPEPHGRPPLPVPLFDAVAALEAGGASSGAGAAELWAPDELLDALSAYLAWSGALSPCGVAAAATMLSQAVVRGPPVDPTASPRGGALRSSVPEGWGAPHPTLPRPPVTALQLDGFQLLQLQPPAAVPGSGEGGNGVPPAAIYPPRSVLEEGLFVSNSRSTQSPLLAPVTQWPPASGPGGARSPYACCYSPFLAPYLSPRVTRVEWRQLPQQHSGSGGASSTLCLSGAPLTGFSNSSGSGGGGRAAESGLRQQQPPPRPAPSFPVQLGSRLEALLKDPCLLLLWASGASSPSSPAPEGPAALRGGGEGGRGRAPWDRTRDASYSSRTDAAAAAAVGAIGRGEELEAGGTRGAVQSAKARWAVDFASDCAVQLRVHVRPPQPLGGGGVEGAPRGHRALVCIAAILQLHCGGAWLTLRTPFAPLAAAAPTSDGAAVASLPLPSAAVMSSWLSPVLSGAGSAAAGTTPAPLALRLVRLVFACDAITTVRHVVVLPGLGSDGSGAAAAAAQPLRSWDVELRAQQGPAMAEAAAETGDTHEAGVPGDERSVASSRPAPSPPQALLLSPEVPQPAGPFPLPVLDGAAAAAAAQSTMSLAVTSAPASAADPAWRRATGESQGAPASLPLGPVPGRQVGYGALWVR